MDSRDKEKFRGLFGFGLNSNRQCRLYHKINICQHFLIRNVGLFKVIFWMYDSDWGES